MRNVADLCVDQETEREDECLGDSVPGFKQGSCSPFNLFLTQLFLVSSCLPLFSRLYPVCDFSRGKRKRDRNESDASFKSTTAHLNWRCGWQVHAGARGQGAKVTAGRSNPLMSASEAIKCVQTSSPSEPLGQMANPRKIPPLVPLVEVPSRPWWSSRPAISDAFKPNAGPRDSTPNPKPANEMFPAAMVMPSCDLRRVQPDHRTQQRASSTRSLKNNEKPPGTMNRPKARENKS